MAPPVQLMYNYFLYTEKINSGIITCNLPATENQCAQMRVVFIIQSLFDTYSPEDNWSCCNFSYYNYISIWPSYIVIHFTEVISILSTLSLPPRNQIFCLCVSTSYSGQREQQVDSNWYCYCYFLWSVFYSLISALLYLLVKHPLVCILSYMCFDMLAMSNTYKGFNQLTLYMQ